MQLGCGRAISTVWFWALILWYHITGWKNFWSHCHLIGPKFTVVDYPHVVFGFWSWFFKKVLRRNDFYFVFCVYPALVLVEVLEVVALQSLLYLGFWLWFAVWHHGVLATAQRSTYDQKELWLLLPWQGLGTLRTPWDLVYTGSSYSLLLFGEIGMITPGRQGQPLRYLRHDACPMAHHTWATLHSTIPVEASHLPDGAVLLHKTPAVRAELCALKKLVCHWMYWSLLLGSLKFWE